MSSLSQESWKRLSPYLDEGLEMSEEERAVWLANLRREHPTIAGQVEALLGQHRAMAGDGFLEETSVPLPGARAFSGQTVGFYSLLSQIGSGGMGSVWLAARNDGRFERQVAIKFLNLEVPGIGAEHRFRREGSILAGLAHPNIAELLDAGVSPSGQPYLVLEYIDGQHIDEYCDQHRLDTRARIRLFLDILAAVLQAHRNLIVHRDIKPSNVLVRKDGRVKLLDFGIAKLLANDNAPDHTTLVTVAGARPMTPGYAAPEQLQGGAITTSTDIYALGVLLYQLLTGVHPGGDSIHAPADLVRAVIEKEPLRPSAAVDPLGDGAEALKRAALRSSTPEKLHRQLRGDLDTIITKALKKEPGERYSSVAALADDLHHYLRSEPISARPDTIAYRAAKFVRRHRVPVVLAGLALAATIAGAGGTLLQARTARQQRDSALRLLARSERLNGLNQLLLSDVAPNGQSLKADDLIQREERIVEHEQYDDVADHIDMLLSIGSQYSGQEENTKAVRLLEEAYQLSRGVKDPATRAKASCELAWAIAPGGELARAESLIQEGLRELPNQPEYAPARVVCYLRGSDLAYRRANAGEVLARALSAERVFYQSPVRPPVQELEVLNAVAGGYEASGQFAKADAAFQRAAARMRSLGYDDTQKAVKLYNDWGLSLSDAGHPLDAAAAFRRAIEISRSNRGEDSVLPALLHNYSLVLRELGDLPAAADYSQRARLRAQQAGDHILSDQATLQLARIYRDQHDFPRAAALLAEVELQLRSKLPPGHMGFAALASDRSQLALAEGDLPAALRLANEAVGLDEVSIKAGRQGAAYLPSLLVRRSAVELSLGDGERAAADASRAVALLRSNMEPGATSSTLGRAELALARALAAQGKFAEAAAASRVAVNNLQVTVGPDHADTRNARKLAEQAALHRNTANVRSAAIVSGSLS